jgi:transposase
MVFNGSYNTLLFETWVEKLLIEELQPGQVVIMDNASFHKSKETRELIESVKCSIIFLSSYSPVLNPIKKFWANLKRWIKNNILQFAKLFDALVAFFSSANAT